MTVQIVFFVGLAVATVGLFVVWPLLRRPAASAIRADYDLRVYRDQLGEVERDRDRGLLTEAQAEAARVEIQRRMLAADSEARAMAAGQAPLPGHKTRRALAALLAVLVPVGTLVMYGVLGTPGMPDFPFEAQQAKRMGLDEAKMAELKRQELALAADAEANPQDQKRWLALAEARAALRESAQALIAFDKAVALGPVAADVWASIGEAQVLASDGAVSEQARAAFVNALRLSRDDARSRYYLGLARVQDGDNRAALAIWRDLSASSPADAPWMGMLRARMGQVARQENLPPMAVTPVHPLDLIDGKATVEVDAGSAMRAEADANRKPGEGFSGDEKQMIGSMVQRLKDRLASQPDDYNGWMQLGRSLTVMKDPAGAVDAYGKAAALKPTEVEPLFNLATSLIDVAEKTGQDQPDPQFFAVVTKAEALAPDSADVLYLGGLAAAIQGDKTLAKSKWTRLLATLPKDGPAYQNLQGQIDSLQ